MAAVLRHTVDEASMVTLNRPHRLNAMDTSLVRELNVPLRPTHAVVAGFVEPETTTRVAASVPRAAAAHQP